MKEKRSGRSGRTRPAELIILSAVVALFVGLVVLLTVRDLELAAIFTGIGFIVSLMILAMLTMVAGPADQQKPPHHDE